MGQIVQFGEWLPDQADFNNPGTPFVLNVVPRTPRSYGPFFGPVSYSNALDNACQGAYSWRDASGNVFNFAGDVHKLYLQTTGSTQYNNVSKAGGYNTSPIPDGFWDMTSFGRRVIATNGSDAVQSFMMPGGSGSASSVFADLSTTAPKAKFCCVIRDFLMLGATTDPIGGAMPYRVWWSAIGDPTSWPSVGTDAAISVQSDFQDLVQTDLGILMALTGGHLSAADGAALMEHGIYRIMYSGSPAVFSFSVAQGATGTTAPMSVVNRTIMTAAGSMASVIYFLGSDGFYAFDGSTCSPIGAQKVDRFFFADADQNFLRTVQGTYDPSTKLVLWFYRSKTAGSQVLDRGLVYNTELNRWAPFDLSATPVEWAHGSIAYVQQGYTLDQLDIFGPLDQLGFSLDSSVWTASQPAISWFGSDHKQAFAGGPPLQPTLSTNEQQLFPGKRARITSTRPIGDGEAPASINVGSREKLRDPIVFTGFVPENIIGDCPQRTTGRYVRFQLRLPPGTAFRALQGIDVTARPEGVR